MTPAEKALRDAFMAECWAPCREVPKEWRDEKRKADRRTQRWMEEAQVNSLSTDRPQESTSCAQGCAQNGSGECPGEVTEVSGGVGDSTCTDSAAPGNKCGNTRPGPDPRVSEGYPMSTAHPPDGCQQVPA